ncbi:MAG TPA: D-sedoheptulose 7-phosphate isomerase [Pyrinomonadaceae bacterium]|nr:D-sedoheptulose 7-phosphate isomerase [Pyrinomonadaceae bacterium]
METTVFTNGCFDLLHPGHVDLLRRAKALGTRLVVGINSDDSVRRIKGSGRPFLNQNERAELLKALESVDEVVVFDELTPENLIKQIEPDVLVKGGDWKPEEIIGSDFVLARGGRVYSLPLLEGYSSSSIVEKIQLPKNGTQPAGDIVGRSLRQHIETFDALLANCGPQIEECAKVILQTVRNGGKILICGNGGSAADAQHIAAEFVGRYETERRALPAIALTTDTSALTALANDYNFDRIFSRQVEALGREGDCLIAISTSGNSPNVIAAVMTARSIGCRVVGMTGANGKKLASLCDASLMVPSDRTARIQEGHITVAHIWCELVDEAVAQE